MRDQQRQFQRTINMKTYFAFKDGACIRVHEVETNFVRFNLVVNRHVESYQINGKYLSVSYGQSVPPEVYDCENGFRVR